MKKAPIQVVKSRIARRLTVAVVLLSSFITLISTGIQLYADYKHDLTKIEDSFSIIETGHLKSLINSVWVHDAPQISTQLEGLLSLPDMEHLEILTDDATDWSVGAARSEHTIEKSFPLTHFYRDKNLEIGVLRATASLDAVYARLQNKVLTILISNGIKTFLVSGFVLFIFNLLVTKHLNKLAKHVKTINIRQKTIPLEWDRTSNKKRENDELDQVAIAINLMQDNLDQAVVKLRESELYNRTLFEQSPIGLALCRMNGELVDCNQAYAEIIGRTIEDVKLLTYWEITPKKYFADEERQLESLKTTQFYGPYEKEYIHKKGHLVPVRLSGKIIEQKGERFIWSCTEDISQRKQAQEQLKMLVERHNAIISTTQDGFWVADQDGHILEINNSYCKMSGYTRDELLTMKISDLEERESSAEIKARIKHIFSEGSSQFETCHRKKNGELIYLEVSVSHTKLDNDSFLCAFLRDISGRRNLETQLRQSQKMEAVGTLAGGIAHDFNNILAIILGNVELASMDVSNSKERLDNIQMATLRGRDVVNQLLTFSSLSQSKKILLNPIPVIKEVLKLIRSTIPSSIEIREKIQDRGTMILADTTKLHQIMINLCANAAQAMGENSGVLEVKMSLVTLGQQQAEIFNIDHGDYLELTVHDTGHGMTPEVQERILEPFFSTKSKDKGTGLGLAVVHGTVQECCGTIQVESKVGYGSTFRLYFPVAGHSPNQEIDKEPTLKIEKGHGRILFVDDEAGLVAIGVRMLNALGYEAEAFTDPQNALKKFAENPDLFDVVITDQIMPNMSGIELAEKILELRPDIPILLSTGFSDTVTDNNAAASGFKKYLQKPVSLKDFASALTDILG
jgi:PAS domain S-box-containing protein